MGNITQWIETNGARWEDFCMVKMGDSRKIKTENKIKRSRHD